MLLLAGVTVGLLKDGFTLFPPTCLCEEGSYCRILLLLLRTPGID